MNSGKKSGQPSRAAMPQVQELPVGVKREDGATVRPTRLDELIQARSNVSEPQPELAPTSATREHHDARDDRVFQLVFEPYTLEARQYYRWDKDAKKPPDKYELTEDGTYRNIDTGKSFLYNRSDDSLNELRTSDRLRKRRLGEESSSEVKSSGGIENPDDLLTELAGHLTTKAFSIAEKKIKKLKVFKSALESCKITSSDLDCLGEKASYPAFTACFTKTMAADCPGIAKLIGVSAELVKGKTGSGAFTGSLFENFCRDKKLVPSGRKTWRKDEKMKKARTCDAFGGGVLWDMKNYPEGLKESKESREQAEDYAHIREKSTVVEEVRYLFPTVEAADASLWLKTKHKHSVLYVTDDEPPEVEEA